MLIIPYKVIAQVDVCYFYNTSMIPDNAALVQFGLILSVSSKYPEGNCFCREPRANSMSSEEWTVEDALNNLNKALAGKDMSIEAFFEEIDADGDETINGPELHKGIRAIVGDILSPGQVSQIIKAFDENEDHRIDLGELKAALAGNASSEEE